MPPRLHVSTALDEGAALDLPPGAARHVQVLRLQPGAALTLFDGRGGEWSAEVLQIGRSTVQVRVGRHVAVERELALPVTLAIGMPANDRMDTLVEKACELGVAAIQPLVCERSVLRLAGERAQKKLQHWQGVAVAACEQSGRTRIPAIAPVLPLVDWLAGLPLPPPPLPAAGRVLLSLREPGPWPALAGLPGLLALSGPEGGLSEAEEAAARLRGFAALSLGPRTLRADTAPLALLAHVALGLEAAG